MTNSDQHEIPTFVGTLVIGLSAFAGFVAGCIVGNWLALATIVLLSAAAWIAADRLSRQPFSEVWAVVVLGAFACLATALLTTGVRLFLTTPGAPLTAFWLYMLIAAGYMVSRCCLGWHVGASAAVLTTFVAVGLFVQSFYGGGIVWLAALIVAAGLWWGADEWRRANGLAINE